MRRTPRRKDKVTSHDVAALARVSRSAVSRAFTPNASVSEKVRRRVQEAAARLGYQPNAIARSLITRKSRMIGLVMADWSNPFYTSMLQRFSEKLQEHGYQLMLLTADDDAGVEHAVRLLLQYQIDKIIIVTGTPSDQLIDEAHRAGARLVILNRDIHSKVATCIVVDSTRIGRDVANALLDAGYRRFAMVRGDTGKLLNAIQRMEGFRATLRKRGLGSIVLERLTTIGYEAGRAFGNEVAALRVRPDAVVCSADVTAIGVLDALRIDQEIDVPAKIAVVGFGNAPAAGWACTGLASIRLPLERMMDAAVAAILGDGGPAPGETVVLPAELEIRSTIRFAKEAAHA